MKKQKKQLKISRFWTALTVVAVLFVVWARFEGSRAALLINLTDTLSRAKISQATTHSLRFKTLTGVDASSDTIIVTFGSGFDLTSVTAASVGLTHGPTGSETSETIAAAAGVNIWGASVSGQAVTLAAPTNAASGEIAANDFLNLSVSNVVNPGTAGNYKVYITGAFGDSGSVQVSIISNDQASVTAHVEGGISPPPPPPPPPPPDTTSPVISNIQVTNITTSGAKISWTTDEASSSLVDYGKTTGYELGMATGTSGGTSHSVTLTGLEGFIVYHFRVRSADAAGNTAASTDQTFKTLSPDTTSPVISNITVTNITGSEATISWTTNEPASTNVDYGLTASYELGAAAGSDGVINHSLVLIGLTSETLYHFRVRSADAYTNEAQSADQTFTTADITPPAIADIQATNITGASADIVWTTNEAASSAVDAGPTAAYELGRISDPALVTGHLVSVIGLAPASTYHFRVTSADTAGNVATSADQTFATLDTIPPVISGISVSNIIPSGATISWHTDEPATTRVRYGRTASYELGAVQDAALITNHSLSLSGLIGNTEYHFSVSSRDAAGNSAASPDQTFVTARDAIPPANVGDFTATAISASKIQLSWSNPPDADFTGVRITRKTEGFFPIGPADQVVFEGQATSFTDIGLTPSTSYYYIAFSVDSSGNTSSGALAMATTLAPPPSPPPPPPEAPPSLGQPPAPVTITPPVEVPPVTVSEAEHLSLNDLYFWAAARQLELRSSSAGEVRILPRAVLGVGIPATRFRETPQKMVLMVGSSAYLLVLDEARGSYETSFVSPAEVGRHAGTLIITYANKTTDVINFVVLVDPFGYVFETINGQEIRVLDALVTLRVYDAAAGNFVTWDSRPYGETNPARTPPDGAFGFMVPSGLYQLRAAKDGYRLAETPPFEVREAVVNRNIELLRPPPSLRDVIKPEAPLAENVVAVAKNLLQKSTFASKVAKEEIVKVIDNPRVEEANQVFAPPVITTVAVSSVAATASFWGFLTYLRFLILQPVLLLERRKRKGWGIVYNSLTKLPVDLAIVRLIDAQKNRVAATRVTGKYGRYAFIVGEGVYKLEVTRPGYVFPTKYLAVAKSDLNFAELYHGEVLEIKAKDQTINVNVPLDPVEKALPPQKIRWQKAARRLNRAVSFGSVVMSGVSFAITPESLTAIFIGVQIALFILFRRLAVSRKPASFGLVFDEKTGKPLKYAIARIFDTQFNKLLETQVTDAKGRYFFLVGKNVYYATYEKPGYLSEKTATLDFTTAKKEAVVDLKVGLKKKK